MDRVIRTHTRHGFTGRLPDGEYEKAIASAERDRQEVRQRARGLNEGRLNGNSIYIPVCPTTNAASVNVAGSSERARRRAASRSLSEAWAPTVRAAWSQAPRTASQ